MSRSRSRRLLPAPKPSWELLGESQRESRYPATTFEARAKPDRTGKRCACAGGHAHRQHHALNPLPCKLRSEACRRTRAARRIAYRRGRSRRCSPRNIGEVEEVQQIRLCCIAQGKVSGGADEAVLDEFDHRRVIHRNIRNIMPPCVNGDMPIMLGSRKPSCAPKPLVLPRRRQNSRQDLSSTDRSAAMALFDPEGSCNSSKNCLGGRDPQLSGFTAIAEISGIAPSDASVLSFE